MSGLPFAPPLAKKSLRDLLALIKRELALDLNCHALGTVQSFNATTQTIQATIDYTQTFYKQDLQTGVYTPDPVEYPPLVEVPVWVNGGGTGAVTMPITKGDQCLIAFNDRDISNWKQGTRQGPCATNALHSFSDAIAFVGLNKVVNYDPARAVLRNGNAYVGVGTELIKIANEMTTLKTVLNGLIDTLDTVLGSGSNSGGPVVFAQLAQLAAYKSMIAGLLE